MATVHATLSRADVQNDGTPMQLITSIPDQAETLTSTASSAAGTIAATRPSNQFWSVTATGNVYVAFGLNPTAVAGAGHLILAGQTRDFSVSVTGEKIAIKDA